MKLVAQAVTDFVFEIGLATCFMIARHSFASLWQGCAEEIRERHFAGYFRAPEETRGLLAVRASLFTGFGSSLSAFPGC